MTNYLSCINNYYLGGNLLDSEWIDLTPQGVLFNGVNFTAKQYVTYSIASYLPDSTYTYECQFDCYIRTGSSSGNIAGAALFPGTLIVPDWETAKAQYICGTMAMVRTSSSSSRVAAGNCILPISPTDQNVTWYNLNGSGTSGGCGLRLIRFRRIGTHP